MRNVFITPIAVIDWPECAEMNAGLRAQCLERESQESGMKRSNIGGWHSNTDLLNWGGPHVEELGRRLRRFLIDLTSTLSRSEDRNKEREYMISAWANVSRDGQYNTMHDHPKAHWSGVYYVCCDGLRDDIPVNAMLELHDPRAGTSMFPFKGMVMTERPRFEPVAGRMVVFPSWLRHSVHPYRGDDVRISIAFNATVRLKDE
ncbi:MAG: TIGR02466 family protein [Pseudomonadota bacterium]